MNCKVILIRTLTPLHVGTGQSVGAIDLPIARERSTGWPIIPGSSIKGVLRDAATAGLWDSAVDLRESDACAKERKRVDNLLKGIFGTSGGDTDGGQAGTLSTTDQRMLLFPVRSYFGTFAYVTSPIAIHRYLELLDLAGLQPPLVNLQQIAPGEGARVPQDSPLVDNGSVYFDDVQLVATQTNETVALGQHLARSLGLPAEVLCPRLTVVSDTNFSFLVEHSTEVVTHVALDFLTKTAAGQMLRSEEAVPAEAVFAGLAVSMRASADPFSRLPRSGSALQFGGKASTGMGLCKVHVLGGNP